MAIVELAGQPRSAQGKGEVRRLRAQGMVPGVVYGPGEVSRMIALPQRSFEAVMRQAATGTVVIDLRISGAAQEDYTVLIKEVQRDPMSSRLLHVDFLHIAMDRPVRLAVPIHVVGIAEGVRTEGGFVDHVLRDLEVECLPAAIPDFIEVDITPLRIAESIHAGDIQREGLTVITPPDRVVVTVHGKTAVIEAPVAAAAAETAAAEGQAAAEGEESKGKPEGKGKPEPKGKSDAKGKSEAKGKSS